MRSIKDILEACEGFDWDEGNFIKNYSKHGVNVQEAEEIFFNQPFIVTDDEKHSMQEKRYAAWGKTDTERLLMIVFTLRRNKIRIISARDMNRKERKHYEQNEEA